ncbi:DoxX family protein [Aggregicoccus sp. 17bor-14]|uniref:DoxX family protein n=1 Tax=Myxococcaceae TaxID=31 RepID=UPI00129C53D8|nr:MULTISPECIES: DoxX family protein [Myxococcaceae]MBF5046651.1 DoxX family protein [Simulacricoccus sp. 17bor-14]MRI92360.1 DoxX family protein [Aggregicoccus sp. 17bor-14]
MDARGQRTGTKAQGLLYWIPTVLLALLMFSGGLMNALQSEESAKGFAQLGYPAYFAVMLGSAKVLGALALLLPVPRVLREWAYAGFTFDVLAAAVSLHAIGAPAVNLAAPLVALALVQLSYFGWRRRSGRAAAQLPSRAPAASWA